MGVSIEDVRRRLAGLLEAAPKVARDSSQINVAPRAAALIDRAKAEADRLSDEFVGTEHLLIALTQEEQGDVSKVLAEFKVDTERATRRCRRYGEGTGSTTPAPRAGTAPWNATAWT